MEVKVADHQMKATAASEALSDAKGALRMKEAELRGGVNTAAGTRVHPGMTPG